ncbi:MAG: DUF1580 domain-containing protein [Pirellulales bacterium]
MELEGLMPLAALAAKLGRRRGGKRTHSSTLARWARKGLRGVKLEVVRMGGVLCTSEAALLRFFAALEQAAGTSTTTRPQSRVRDAAQDRLIEAKLRAHGLRGDGDRGDAR